jgi:hypothetical protein
MATDATLTSMTVLSVHPYAGSQSAPAITSEAPRRDSRHRARGAPVRIREKTRLAIVMLDLYRGVAIMTEGITP